MPSTPATLLLSPGPLHHGRRWLSRHAAGLALCALLALAAQAMCHWPVFDRHGIGTLTLALLLGIVAGNGLPQRWLGPAEHGAALSRQRLLRAGVMLFGLGLILAAPYLVIGTVWSFTHTDHLRNMHGLDLVVSFLGSIVSWPVLLFANVCMT